jgi:cell division protein YceG involved in septum cleavage
MKGEKLSMRINLISSFAAGILITTTICSVVYFTDSGDTSKASAKTAENNNAVKAQPSEKEMVKQLEDKGYVVVNKDDYDKTIKDEGPAEQKQATPEEEKKEVTQVVVNVTEGMTSIDVGHQLVQGKLVQDAFTFSKDIEAKGLQNKLRPGAYTVNSGMSYDEVISTIFM